MRRLTIGFLADWLKDDYQNTLFGAVQTACEEFDLHLVVLTPGILESDQVFSKSRNALYDLVSPTVFDGLILLVGTLSNHVGLTPFAQFCERYEPIPMVSIAIPLPTITSIVVDNTEGMRTAIVHLIELHRRQKIAFVRGPDANEEAESRYAVYREVLAEYGLVFDEARTFLGDFQSHAGADAVKEWLARGVEFDAVVCANDFMALGVLGELRARGIDVPRAVSVAGFDDIQESVFSHPALATVRQPFHEQGQLAVRLILDKIAGRAVPLHHTLGTDFVPRMSCGCSSHAIQSLRPRPLSDDPDTNLASDRLRDLWLRLAPSQTDSLEQFTREFFLEIRSSGKRRVLGLFERLTGELPEPYSGWQNFLTRLREQALCSGALDSEAMLRMEERIHAGRLLLAELALRAQANRRFESERWARGIAEASEALHTAFDRQAIVDALATHLPSIAIQKMDVVRWRPGESRAMLWASCESREGKLDQVIDTPTDFDVGTIIPRSFQSNPKRASWVIEPLFVANDFLGYVVFGFGPSSGRVYEVIANQMSGALMGVDRLQKLMEAVELREQAERARMRQELEIASTIQMSILPRRLEVRGLELAALMRPATEVGGDYYDVLPQKDGAWIGIGDVAGHGLGTGLMMLMIQSVVSTMCRGDVPTNPREIVRRVNSVLYENIHERLEKDEHATFCILRYFDDGRLVFSGAHEDLLVYRANTQSCETIATPGPWIAARKNIERALVESETQLDVGDILVLYTDGVTEACSRDGHRFGLERLAAVVEQHATATLEVIRERVMEAITQFAPVQDDDLTLVLVRRVSDHEN